ncbi:integrase, catalytic region, zinc finger, CCHC-type containing protein [Tanacetum coccineum]
MDSIIPLRQKNTLAEYMILSGADNRPPMLDKDLSCCSGYSLQNAPIACLKTRQYAFLTVFSGEIMLVDKQGLLNATTVKIQGFIPSSDFQTIIPNNAAFQTEDLDTYDSDCNDISNAKADLEQTPVVDVTDNEITSDRNIEKANKEQNNESVTIELERYKERVKTFEQRLNIDLSSREKMIDSQMDDMIKEKLALKEQVDTLEQNLSKQIKEKESLLQTFTIFKNEFKEKENKYMENEIDLEKKINELDNIIFKLYDNAHKQALGYQNSFYLKKDQRIKPTLYDGIVIFDKHVAMPVIDDEETLILEEESLSKMSEKEKDPEAIKQNISHKPIDYVKLNRLSEDFRKRFVPQQELSAEQTFWYHMLNPSTKSSDASPVKMEAPKELPKVSLVNESLKKLKFHLATFDNVVVRNTKSIGHFQYSLPADIYSLVNHHRVSKDLWERVQLLMQGVAVPVFSPGDDPIACLNKAMTFLTVEASSRINLELPRIQETMPLFKMAGSGGNNANGQARVVKCYNCQGEGHMARQCTQPKRPRNATWYKDKAMLAEAQEAGQILDKEQLTFLTDPWVPDWCKLRTRGDNNSKQCCDFRFRKLILMNQLNDVSNAKAVLMDNISNYGSDVISEVPHSETYLNVMENQSVHAMQDFEQSLVVDFRDNDIHRKANKEQLNESVTAELERYKERVKTFEQRLNIDLRSHEKMIDSQMDDMIKEKLALKEQVDSLELSKDFGKHFTPQQELSAEQAFWFRISNPTSESSNKPPVKVEVPSELPKVSLVNTSLKKLKFRLAQFDSVVKKRTTSDARTEDLLNEIMEVQTVFDQMDAAVQQSLVDKQCLEISKKELLLENDRLLQQIMSQDVLLTVMNSMSLNGESVNMERKRNESCDKCFNLDAELLKSQNAHNDLLKSYSQLDKHCIYLELSIQLKQEIFQKHESCDNQNALEILEFFENNDLKAQLQEKNTTICKLKEIIKSMREKSKEENVNYDYCEIETKNVELENSVATLLLENERLCKEINHVKQVFKYQFDSIKNTRVRTTEHSDSLIDKLNLKCAENEDLKA